MLPLWGPPFAGEAYVDLGIVAFTVPIGDQSASREQRKLDWNEFRTQFLPDKPLRITITGGIVQEHKGDGKTDPGFIIVNPSELRLSVESFVPFSSIEESVSAKLGIRPIGEKNLASTLTLEWTTGSPKTARRPIKKSIPEALWSREDTPDARRVPELEAKTILNVLMGVEVLPLECSQYPKPARVHTIETHEIKPPPSSRRWLPKRTERAGYYEKNPAIKRNLFGANLKRPKPDVIKDVAEAGFGNIAVDVERIFAASDPTGVWLAAPTFVKMGKLPPLPLARESGIPRRTTACRVKDERITKTARSTASHRRVRSQLDRR